MTETMLILSLITTSVTVAQDGAAFVKAIKAMHHHTTRVVYRHVLRPTAKEIAKCK